MIENIRVKKIFFYGISGIITTIISIVSYKIFLLLKIQYIIALTLSQILAITFAFFSTRKRVYESKAKSRIEISKEYTRFIIGRAILYFVNLILLIISVDVLKFDKFNSNVVITIIVIIINYFIGDFMINKFRSRKDLVRK